MKAQTASERVPFKVPDRQCGARASVDEYGHALARDNHLDVIPAVRVDWCGRLIFREQVPLEASVGLRHILHAVVGRRAIRLRSEVKDIRVQPVLSTESNPQDPRAVELHVELDRPIRKGQAAEDSTTFLQLQERTGKILSRHEAGLARELPISGGHRNRDRNRGAGGRGNRWPPQHQREYDACQETQGRRTRVFLAARGHGVLQKLHRATPSLSMAFTRIAASIHANQEAIKRS